jgi:hypothetical protein
MGIVLPPHIVFSYGLNWNLMVYILYLHLELLGVPNHSCTMTYLSWNLLSKLTRRGGPKSLIDVECFYKLYLFVISYLTILKQSIQRTYRVMPPSRAPTITWPTFPKPPKKYRSMWSAFLRMHISPYLTPFSPCWKRDNSFSFYPTFFRHRISPHLYCLQSDELMRSSF